MATAHRRSHRIQKLHGLILARYASGISASQIASTIGVNEKTVKNVLRSAGVQIRSGGSYFEKTTCQQRAEIVARYRAGEGTTKIANDLGVHFTRVYAILKGRGEALRSMKEARRTKHLNEAAFSPLKCRAECPDGPLGEEAAYWVGFLMADGCVHVPRYRKISKGLSLKLAAKDLCHLEKFRTFLGSTHKIGRYHRVTMGKRRKAVGLSVASDQMVNDLSRFGVVPRKTHIARFKLIAANRHAWRGLIDGDGCLHFASKAKTWIIQLLGSWPIMRQFRAYCLSIVPLTRAEVRRVGKMAAFRLSGRAAVAVIRQLYADCKVSLDRKESLARRALNEV